MREVRAMGREERTMDGEQSESSAPAAEGTAERKRGADDRPAAVREAHRKMCALFDACRDEGSARGIRDAALLSVLYGAGVPRATALALPLAAYDADRAVLTWPVGGRQADVGRSRGAGRERGDGFQPDDGRGSGLRARRATDGARAALEEWLEVRGTAPGPLLCRPAGGSGTPRPLAGETVTSILRRWARRSGVETPDEAELIRHYTSPWWEDVGGEGKPA